MSKVSKEHLENLKYESLISESIIKSAELESWDQSTTEEKIGFSRGGLAFPYWDLNGNLIGHRLRSDIQKGEDIPTKGNKKAAKYLQEKGTSLSCYFDKDEIPKLKDASIPLIIAEGEKKVLSCKSNLPSTFGFCGTPGCWNFCEQVHESKILSSTWRNITLKGRQIYLLADTDIFSNPNVLMAYEKFINLLINEGATVHLIDLKIEGLEEKIGADDFIKIRGSEELLKRVQSPFWTHCSDYLHNYMTQIKDKSTFEIINEKLKEMVLIDEDQINIFFDKVRPYWENVQKSNLKNIFSKYRQKWKNNFQHSTKSNELIWDLHKDPFFDLFKELGKKLEKIENYFIEPNTLTLIYHDTQRKKSIVILTGKELSPLLLKTISLRFWNRNPKGNKVLSPYKKFDPDILDSFLSNPLEYAHQLRHLEFTTDSPILLRDKLINEKGYHPNEKILHTGEKIEPTRELIRLFKLLNTFPFKGKSDLVNTLGSILGGVFLLQDQMGKHPGIIINADSENVGKTTLANTLSIICTGSFPTPVTFLPNEEEMEKRTAAAILGSNFINFNNIKYAGTISSSCLERSLTDKILSYRRLGSNQLIQKPNNVQFCFTINDGTFSPDLIIRVVPITLTMTQLQKRPVDFDPIKYAQENRNVILRELVGMVSIWIEQGCKKVPVKYPKYPEWASIVNGILLANGIEGFLGNFDESSRKLDSITNALFTVILLEIRTKPQTEKRSPSQWRKMIEEQIGKHVFDPNATDRSKDTRVGNCISKILNKIVTIPDDDEEEIHIKAKAADSKKGGYSKVYYFKKIFTYETIGEENVNNSQDVNPDTLETLETYKGISEGFEIQKEQFSLLLPNKVEKVSEVSDGENREKEVINCSDILESNIPKSWLNRSPEPCFLYQFYQYSIPSFWWDGSYLGNILSIDIETTLKEIGKVPSYILGSVCNGKNLIFLKKEQLSRFFEVHKDSTLIAHNAVFELEVLSKTLNDHDFPYKKIDKDLVFDTQIFARLINLARIGAPERKSSLSVCVKDRFGIDLPKDIKINNHEVRLSYFLFQGNISQAPNGYFHYNAFDTISTFFLFEVFQQEINELTLEYQVDPKLSLSHFIQLKGAFACEKISQNGLNIDKNHINELYQRINLEIKETLDSLSKKFNYSPGKGSKKRFENIILEIEKKKSLSFPRKIDKRGNSVIVQKEKDLEPFKDNIFIKELLRYNYLNKVLKNFIVPYLNLERVHPQFDILKATGRISIQKPALQTLPKEKNGINLRKTFVPGEGQVFLKCDFVGAELVTLAQVCLDEFSFSRLADAINNDQDIHRLTASEFIKKESHLITSEERQAGKAANFGLPAGMGLKQLIEHARDKYQVELTLEMAEEIKASWLRTFPEMDLYLKEPEKNLLAQLNLTPFPSIYNSEINPKILLGIFLRIMKGETKTSSTNKDYGKQITEWAWANMDRVSIKFKELLGEFKEQVKVRRGSPDLHLAINSLHVSKIPRTGRIRARCKSTDFNNNPFQGILSDISKEGMYELTKAGYRVCHTIHDEVLIEIPANNQEQIQGLKSTVENILRAAAKKYCPDVKMKVATTICQSWGE